MPVNISFGGLKAVLATAFATAGLIGVTFHTANILIVWIVWLIVGLILAIL